MLTFAPFIEGARDMLLRSSAALRTLRRHQQVEPELSALGGNPDGVLSRHRDQRIGRLGRADIMSLVNHNQDRAALLAPTPQVAEHRRGDQGLLLARGQRAQVNDNTADALM